MIEIRIDDYNSKDLDLYARTREVDLYHLNEPDLGVFIAESPKVIERALDSGYEMQSILVEEEMLKEETNDGEILNRILRKVEDLEKSGVLNNVFFFKAKKAVIEKLRGFNMTRGALAVMRRRELSDLDSVLEGAKRIAILDEVVNPTNLGAIFRSAAALHMDAVVLTSNCTDPLYKRAIRVSMGNVFNIPWTTVDSEGWVRELKARDFSLAALALDEDSISISDPILKMKDKLGLVLGNEGNGLSLSTIKSCDHTVMIPMSEGVDSLNVAAASAVAFWEITRE
jgi:tRNA G18 (ribose-2'-O)-methylase SpoU